MSEFAVHQLSTIGADPVSDASPCGENVRYDPVFEELEAELAKQESLNAETVDWKRVVDLSSAILKNFSKDLLVGSYLAQALLITEGYSGLSTGLKILNEMVSNHWDGLFPPTKRMRARQTAISWLAERAGLYISDRTPAANDAQAIVDAADLVKQLDGVLVDKMGDQAPMLSDLSKPLKNYKQSAAAGLARDGTPEAKSAQQGEAELAPKPAPATTDLEPAPTARSAKPASQAVIDVESDADAKKLLRQVQESVRKVSTYKTAKKLSDPVAYRLSRIAAWMLIDNPPPNNEGVTQVAPPAAERLKSLDGQIEKSEYSGVLPELEKTLSRSPFWLDGQHKVVTVLRAMGGEYENATNAVIEQTRHFLQRVPAILDLSFSDNTPFASDQTKMWLQSEVLVAGGGGGVSASSAVAGIDAWDEALEKARKKAAGGDNEGAIGILSAGIESAGQLRDKFYWRCALADLLLQTGNPAAAAGVLTHMTLLSEQYNLPQWEPGLLSRIYSLLYQSYRKQQGKKKNDALLAEQVDNAYSMLCWFDPVTALKMKGEK